MSCTVTQNGLGALDARRWRPPVDWSAHGLDEAVLRDRNATIRLEEYITFHRALARSHCGAPVPLPREHRRVGREMMTHGASGPFRHLASLTHSTAELYKAVFGWVFMGHLPMVRCVVSELGPGRIHLDFSLDPSFPDSECLFHSFAGSAEMLPLMAKGEPAQVDLTASSHEAHIEVQFAATPSLSRRISRRARQVLTSWSAGGEMNLVSEGLQENVRLLEQSNRALQQSQTRWNALNKHLPGAVWLLDADGIVVESSGVMANTLLPARANGTPRALVEVFAPSSQLAVEDALKRLRAGAPYVDFEAATASGDLVLSCTGGPAPLNDATSLVVAQDVTARRDAERTAQQSRQRLGTARRMEAIGRLAAGLAHDTNNLLMNIRGNAQLVALERENDPDLLESMGRIMSAVDRADTLTRNALSPSSHAVEEDGSTDLAPLLREFYKGQQGGAVPVVLLSPPPGDLHVAVPASLLDRVLLNLVLNARQAIERSGVGDTITLHVRLSPSHQVKLSVHDNGPGMDSATLTRALEPFFTTRAQGSGLGLSNSWWSLRRLGADLTLNSRPGAGTTAVVTLPLLRSTHQAPSDVDAQPRRTVLLVDDEPELRQVIRKVLESLHLQVLEGGSGAEALTQLETLTASPALLICDLTLPRSSGCRVAADVRHHYPDVPVLFLSGVPDHEGHQRALESEATFLRKPFRLEQLQASVDRLLR